MSKRVGPVGNYLGDAFDDGVFDGVKKVIVSVEGSPYNCVSMIKIEYEKDGKLESRQHGTVRGELKEVKNGKFCYKILLLHIWIFMLDSILFGGSDIWTVPLTCQWKLENKLGDGKFESRKCVIYDFWHFPKRQKYSLNWVFKLLIHILDTYLNYYWIF